MGYEQDPMLTVESALAGKKCLLVASTGGHLAQLSRLAKRYSVSEDSVWLTFDSAQSRSLLSDSNYEFVDYIKPRDFLGVLRSTKTAKALLRRRFETVVSTGAALALTTLPYSKKLADNTLYIESVSRLEGPSLTGRLVSLFPHVKTFTQHASWSSEKWIATPGVLDTYQRYSIEGSGVDKVFVTLGTIQGYRFDRMVNALLETGLCGENTVWQLGENNRDDLPGTVLDYMTAEEFENHARSAQVVVTHAGVGTIMQLLDWGISPVVVPRSREFDEHVDDHQHQIANFLKFSGLCEVVMPNELSPETLIVASTSAIRS